MTMTPEAVGAFDAAVRGALEAWALVPSPEQLAQMRGHFELMVEANRTMNLTRITDPAEAGVKHFADSLALCPWAACVGLGDAAVLDVGTGAGFPGLPLAVMRPNWNVTAIDGTGKKMAFVKRVVTTVGLPNVRTDAIHADHWKTHRRFDVVIVRAVGAIGKSLPFAARLTAPGGWFVSYKTPGAADTECASARALSDALGMLRCEPFDYTLPAGEEKLERRLVVYQRTKS